MTGLFDVLIDAAKGTAPVITQRPRQRFAPVADGQPPAGIETEDVQTAATPAPRKAAEANSRQAEERRTRRVAGDDPAEASDRRRQRRAMVDQRPDRRIPQVAQQPLQPVRSILSQGPLHIEENDAPRGARTFLSDFTPSPQDVKSREVRPEPWSQMFERREAEPLLLPGREEDSRASLSLTETSEPPRRAQESASADRTRMDAPGIELRIGRIEVTGAPPPAAPKQTSRPVRVPRAGPRQTLEDYLARRRT
jgi:hypothetical protein